MAKIERAEHIEAQMDALVQREFGLPAAPGVGYKAYLMNDEVKILISTDAGRIHMSISCDDRLPTWDEVHEARYHLLPLAKHFVMALPPPQFYVNDCVYAFHLWEVTEPSLQWVFEQM